MANTSISLKKSSVSGRVPKGETLAVGELAINLADALLFSKQSNGNVITIGGSGTKGEKGDVGLKGDKGELGALDLTLDSFTGNGTANSFTLTTTPVNENYTQVVIDGVSQLKTVYTVTGNTLTFAAPPSNNALIEVTTFTGGAKGDKGEAGLTGSAGTKGDKGEVGDKGEKGADGFIGSNGAKGDKGDIGDKGDKGDTGQKGDKGVDGIIGSNGDKGDKGDTGTKGDKGDQGIQGDKGDTGSKGDKGDAGLAGDKGAQGDKGDTGSKGDKGDTGQKGDKGETGQKGDTGSIGLQGDKGDKGSTGAIANYTYVTSNTSANPYDVLIADTSSGAFTISLPGTPTQGQWVKITDPSNWAVNNLTIDRNGSTIEGYADNLDLNIGNIIVEFAFTGNTWVVSSTAGTKGEKGESGTKGDTGSTFTTGKAIAMAIVFGG